MKKSYTITEILIILVTVLITASFIYFALTYKNPTIKSGKIPEIKPIISIVSNKLSQPQASLRTGNNTTVMTMQTTTSKVSQKNNQTIFADIQPNTDAVYKKVKNGIKEEIILRQKPDSQPEYKFTINADGLRLQQLGGQYYFFDDKGYAQITIPKPFMIDARGIKSEAVEITFKRSGATYQSTIKPNFQWLISPDREYPISIDPSLILPDSPIQELIDKRTANTQTFNLGNGKFASVSDLGASFYQDESGVYQEKNTTIVASDDQEYNYMNITNSFKTYFSSDGFGQKKAVKFQIDDAWMKFKLAGASGQGSLTNNEYNQFDYQGVYQDGTKKMDALYTLSDNQLLEEIVLNEFQGYPEIKQEIETHNIYFKPDGKKINAYHKVTNKLLWIIPEPVMYEKNNTEIANYGLHYEITCSNNNVIIEQCNNLLLTKVIDQEGKDWLADPTRQYPLVIDLTAGPNNPATAGDNTSIGTTAWSSWSTGTIFSSNDAYWRAQVGITSGGIPQCLFPDTLILMQNSEKKISEIQPGELVWSRNPDGQKIELKKVLQSKSFPFNQHGNQYYLITYFDPLELSFKSIRATADHIFYTNIGLISAEQLQIGHLLIGPKLQNLPILSIRKKIDQLDNVWGLTVENNHNYFANNVLVHNEGLTYDNSVKLIKGGTISGDDKVSANAWTDTDTYVAYGGPTDTWGLSWTNTDINASNFGLAFSAKGLGYIIADYTTHYLTATNFSFNIPDGATIDGIYPEVEKKHVMAGTRLIQNDFSYVDHVRITVYYSESSPTETPTPVPTSTPIPAVKFDNINMQGVKIN